MNTKAFILTLSALLMTIHLWAQSPVADFTSNAVNGCSPIIVNFQDKSSGNVTSWHWDFGNGVTSTRQNPSTSYITAGTYTVKLTVTNANGSNTVTKTSLITVYDGPKVDFVTDKTTSCAPGRFQFTDRSTAAAGTRNISWLWDFGDGNTSTEQNPLHVYRSTGKFTILLKVTNDKGCTKILSKPNLVTVTAGVTINFTNTLPALCHAPAAITFTDRSTGPATLSQTWLFGDGNTSTTKNPVHVYQGAGTFPVSLIVSSSQGCVDTLTRTNAVTIGGITGNITVSDTLCAATSLTFRNTSTPMPSSSRWEFPDGTISTQTNPVKTFPTAGTYAVRLINQYASCKDTIDRTISVSAKPVIDFSSTDTINCNAPFTANLRNGTNEAVSYLWTFSDGGSSTDANPNHTFNNFGNYNVKLKATNLAGCADSVTKTAFIKIKKPVISFKNLPARGCLPYEIGPVAEIITQDEVLTYEWDFGNGDKASGQSPKYTYTTQGSFPVKLTITTSTGCTETYTLPNAVRVGTKPTANFTSNATEVCASSSIQFSDRSSPTDEYYWYFGDGGTSRAKNPAYRFVDTGSMNVTLIAYNSGCGDTISRDNYVNIKPPIANFTFRPDCDNRLLYTFTDKSIGAESWSWDFGDGKTSNAQNPTNIFPDLGTYTVSLTVSNGSCTYLYSATIRIVDQTPDFTVSSQVGCKNFRPTFNATSPVQVTAYHWTFGNGQTGTGSRPVPTYTAAGEYDVTLTTTDIYGCKDTRTKTKHIQVLGPTASFVSNTNQGCKGLSTTFINDSKTDGTNGIVNWQWSFGDNKGQSTEQSPTYIYDATGSFHVKLVVQDAAGCKDSLTRNNFVQVSTIKAAWNAVTQSCPKAPVTFNNTTTGNFTSTWTLGDGISSPVKSPSYAYADTGYYTIKLKVRDAIGCEDSLTRENHLYIGLPEASFTANNLISYCTPFEAKFTNTSKFYNSFVWSFQSGTSTVKDPVTYYTTTTKDVIRLIVTSPGGCKDTATESLEIKSAAEGLITYGPLVSCAPVTVNFQAFEPINAKFTWDFGDGNMIDTNVNRLSYEYKDFGKYLPKVILEEQCVVPLIGKDIIHVYGVDARFEMDKLVLCDTGTIAFSNSSTNYGDIRSYRWDFGDGEFSSQQHPYHFYKQPGSYKIRLDVENQAGCSDSALFSPLKVVQSPRISIMADTAVCIGERVQFAGNFKLTDTSAVRWQWQFPNGNSSDAQNPAVQLFSKTGSYQVRTLVTNSSGCMDSAFLPLHVHSIPKIEMPAALTTFNGTSITIPATYSADVVKYHWMPDNGLSCNNCPQPVAAPKLSTQYTVTATDINGCKTVGNIHLAVLCKNSNVFVPNTFSPNGDGKNDIFYVRGKGIERVRSFRIFNRWGELVFEKREVPVNIESDLYGWNGTYKGTKAHPDVYIYQVEVNCDNGEILRFQGNVSLIR